MSDACLVCEAKKAVEARPQESTCTCISLLLGHRRQLLADDKADLREFKERFLVG